MYLHKVSKIVHILKNRKNVGCQGLEEQGKGELFNGYRVLQDEKVLEIYCTVGCVRLTLLYSPLKNG